MMYIQDDDKEEKKDTPLSDPLAEKFLKTRQIILSGEVNKELADKVIRQLLMLEADTEDSKGENATHKKKTEAVCQEADKPIFLYIDSPGGDVDAGFAIFDMIRFIKCPVVIIGMGLVASAAALILLSVPKERRAALPNSHYLIHQPMSGMKGVATDIEIHAKELSKTRAKLNEIIAQETGKDIAQVEKDTDRDYWLDAEAAKEYGLVSRVISKREEAAC